MDRGIFKEKKNRIFEDQGFSLIEVILAFTIFVLIVTTLIGSFIYAQQSTAVSGLRARAVLLAEEGVEAVRSIRDDAWNEIRFDQSGIDRSSNQWELTGEGSTETIEPFTRVITFQEVCRNAAGSIAECPADYTDIHTIKVHVEVSWEYREGFAQSVVREAFLVNWRSSDWVQTDWSGGLGQDIWSDETRYLNDDGNLDVSNAGQVSLEALSVSSAEWAFDSPSNYSYDPSKIEVLSGLAELVGTSDGQINKSVIDFLEFDTTKGDYTEILNISGDVYAIAYSGPGDDGIIKTISIQTDGEVSDSAIDELEYDTSKGVTPDIVHISGNVYAIAYTGEGDDGFIKTISIESNGQIQDTIIDTLEFDTDNGDMPSIVNVSGDVYAVAYEGDGSDGFIKTVTIENNGQITDTVIDTLEFDTTQGKETEIISISGDVYAIAYSGDKDDGFVITVEIDTGGQITDTVIDTLEFDTDKGVTPNIKNISGDVYAVVYSGSGDDGFLGTVSINSNGQIDDTVIDTMEFDTSKCLAPVIESAGGNIYTMAYTGGQDDGYLITVEIDSSGSINDTVLDSYEFDTDKAKTVAIASIDGTVFAISYSGPGDDGYVVTISLEGTMYPDDRPSIYPVASGTATGITTWISFSETAEKNGGEIYYQISDDDGVTWYYWSGTEWVVAGVDDYNPSDIVDANISSFSTANEKIMFKAFLESDGSQFVKLDHIKVDYSTDLGGGAYKTEGWLLSSAYDMSQSSAIQTVSWAEDIPDCPGDCLIKLQLRGASDDSGTPGIWSEWYGESGEDTYFSQSTGNLVPLELNENQWVQYRIYLIGDGTDTPILHDVHINYN